MSSFQTKRTDDVVVFVQCILANQDALLRKRGASAKTLCVLPSLTKGYGVNTGGSGHSAIDVLKDRPTTKAVCCRLCSQHDLTFAHQIEHWLRSLQRCGLGVNRITVSPQLSQHLIRRSVRLDVADGYDDAILLELICCSDRA